MLNANVRAKAGNDNVYLWKRTIIFHLNL